MILLEWDRTARHSPGSAAIFGTGLIGQAVIDALQRTFDSVRMQQMLWNWSLDFSGQDRQIVETAHSAVNVHADSVFITVWAAGRSGFGTDIAGMQAELQALEEVMKFACDVGRSIPLERRCFIHTSSAGGLFEGQTACVTATKPVPLRPYGEGKMAQEASVHKNSTLGRRQILRPSSVYGYVPGGRRGLFTVLSETALKGRTANIMGAMNTLRDYVFAGDIGRFIANSINNHASNLSRHDVETILLASGRAASIYEVVNLIQSSVGRPLFMKIDPRPENARHNTFLRSALPKGFRPTALHEGVALTVGAVSRDRYRGLLQ